MMSCCTSSCLVLCVSQDNGVQCSVTGSREINFCWIYCQQLSSGRISHSFSHLGFFEYFCYVCYNFFFFSVTDQNCNFSLQKSSSLNVKGSTANTDVMLISSSEITYTFLQVMPFKENFKMVFWTVGTLEEPHLEDRHLFAREISP